IGARDLGGQLGELGGRLGRAGEAAVTPDYAMGIVPPEVARALPYETRMPEDGNLMGHLREAVERENGAIGPDGIEMDLTRHQKQWQPGLDASGLGGGYYHPGVGDVGDNRFERRRYQTLQDSTERGVEGGSQKIEGPTLFKRPLIKDFSKEARDPVTGEYRWRAQLYDEAGVPPEQRAAIDDIYKVTDRYGTRRQTMTPEFLAPYLERAGLPPIPKDVPYDTALGREWLGQFITHNLARRAGYDSLIDLQKGHYRKPYGAPPGTPDEYTPAKLGEIVGLREGGYPGPNGGVGGRPE